MYVTFTKARYQYAEDAIRTCYHIKSSHVTWELLSVVHIGAHYHAEDS